MLSLEIKEEIIERENKKETVLYEVCLKEKLLLNSSISIWNKFREVNSSTLKKKHTREIT